MLKILKYDWKNGWNAVRTTLLIAVILSILCGVVLAMAGGEVIINDQSFLIGGDDSMDTFTMIVSISWFAVMLALLVLTLDTIFRNLVSRMFGPEGYLTHTLPVNTWELLLGKATGTWLFGVFMVFVAIFNVMLVVFSTIASSGTVWSILSTMIQSLPKLGEYHFQQIASGFGWAMYGLLSFLVYSFLLVVQAQFICIAARQFGKYHVAGGIVVFWVLGTVESKLNESLSMGFLIILLSSAVCFAASHWLLKHRLKF